MLMRWMLILIAFTLLALPAEAKEKKKKPKPSAEATESTSDTAATSEATDSAGSTEATSTTSEALPPAPVYEERKMTPEEMAKYEQSKASFAWRQRTEDGRGTPEEELELARSYETGNQNLQSFEQAQKWYVASAKHGNVEAMVKAADNFIKGQGCSVNKPMAWVWLTLAIEKDPAHKLLKDSLIQTMAPEEIKKAEDMYQKHLEKLKAKGINPEAQKTPAPEQTPPPAAATESSASSSDSGGDE